MSEPARPGSLPVALLALALAAFASGQARQGARDEAARSARAWQASIARLERLPPLAAPIGTRAFWIGGWVGPPVRDFDAATWGTFRAAGFDVSMGPLEDRYRRQDNLDRLAALAALDSTLTFVRDDSLHPDETTRPGWEGRIRAIVRAYAGAPTLAGYFLADEPAPSERARWTPSARLLRALDPAHPAYVNFVGVSPADAGDAAALARWRAHLEAAVVEGELPFFTVDAYPFPESGGEGGHFLVTLREAAHVAHATARPFGAVLQFTGHGPLRAVRAGEAAYQAMQALAHGASCVVWFTYWTPDPSEEPWRWRGGVVDHDGVAAERHALVRTVNADLRRLAALRGPRPTLVVHLPGRLPPGIVPAVATRVPGLASASGPALSVGFTGATPDGERRYVLVHRDTDEPGTCRLRFAAEVDSARVLGLSGSLGARPLPAAPGTGPGIELRLPAGGGAVIAAWSTPRTTSRSGRR